MTIARNKRAGYDAEVLVVGYLGERGYDECERRRLAGVNDRGDVAGLRGITMEVKSAGERITLPAWIRETERERATNGDRLGVLVVKPKGTRDAESFPAVVPLGRLMDLLVAAGWIAAPTGADEEGMANG